MSLSRFDETWSRGIYIHGRLSVSRKIVEWDEVGLGQCGPLKVWGQCHKEVDVEDVAAPGI